LSEEAFVDDSLIDGILAKKHFQVIPS